MRAAFLSMILKATFTKFPKINPSSRIALDRAKAQAPVWRSNFAIAAIGTFGLSKAASMHGGMRDCRCNRSSKQHRNCIRATADGHSELGRCSGLDGQRTQSTNLYLLVHKVQLVHHVHGLAQSPQRATLNSTSGSNRLDLAVEVYFGTLDAISKAHSISAVSRAHDQSACQRSSIRGRAVWHLWPYESHRTCGRLFFEHLR